jgi:hypothetical protein
MHSAPAAFRIPLSLAQVEAAFAHEPPKDECYPWVAHTPEFSPRGWDVFPDADHHQLQPMLSSELLQVACAPYFEQMCCSVTSDVFAQPMPACTMASREVLRSMCEPFFEQMLSAVQQTLEQEAQAANQPLSNACYACCAPRFSRAESLDSTEATDSSAFASLLSGMSSEEDALDIVERKSDTSDLDVDRSAMVCRHWKSKGWCRLGSNCKFLHPEHKCGVSAPQGAMCVDGVVPSMALARRRKRGGKNRSNRGQQEHPVTEGQNVGGQGY